MALDIFSKYATDEALENNGVWRQIAGGVELLIARSGNPKYAKLLTKEVDRARLVLDGEDARADKVSNEIMVDVIARTILLDWRTKGEDGSTVATIFAGGKDLPYSVENAKVMLALKDFRRQVAVFSDEMDAYKVKEEAAQGEA